MMMDNWDLHRNDGGPESQGELGKVSAMTTTKVVTAILDDGGCDGEGRVITLVTAMLTIVNQ